MFRKNRNVSQEDNVPLVEVDLPAFVSQGQHAAGPRSSAKQTNHGGKGSSPLIISDDAADRDLEPYSSRYDSRSNFSGESDEEGNFVAGPGRNSRRKSTLRWPTGWRFGTLLAAGLTLLILIGNVVLLGIFVSETRRSGSGNSIAAIRTGKCDEIKKLNVGIHIVINIISTLLLGASNYCMQTVSAPTRHDVDKAHAKGTWLQIGVPSFQNLKFIDGKRLFVWLCLGASSIPLHLVYNSIFFMSTSNNMYRIHFADQSFETGASFNETFFSPSLSSDSGYDPKQIQTMIMSDNSVFQNLTNDECLEAYAKNLLEDRGALVLVIEPPKDCLNLTLYKERPCSDPSTTSLYKVETYKKVFLAENSYVNNWYAWICSQQGTYMLDGDTTWGGTPAPSSLCSDGEWKSHLGQDVWEVEGMKVKYCLSEQVPSRCQLHVATNLIAAVVAFNVVKLIIIGLMSISNWINSEPLVTVGDAAASFINRPDPATRGMCLLSAKDILKMRPTSFREPQIYQPHSGRWASAVTTRRWVLTSVLTAAAVVIISGFLAYAVFCMAKFGKNDFQSVWSLGLGSITPYTLIAGWNVPTTGEVAVVSTVLLTNLPQLLLSFLYLLLNGTITAMTATWEWSKFAHHIPKPLRVSFPEGQQRSTFFLQLPYRYSIPLMAVSVLMHWLVSQSIYIAQVIQVPTWEPEDVQEKEKVSNTTTTAGFSPVAMFFTALVVLVVFLVTVALGRFKLQSGMPVVGNCSAAIAAACHCLEGTSSRGPVKWGAVIAPEFSPDGVGHCSFSNHQVELPEPGSRYAGYSDATSTIGSLRLRSKHDIGKHGECI